MTVRGRSPRFWVTRIAVSSLFLSLAVSLPHSRADDAPPTAPEIAPLDVTPPIMGAEVPAPAPLPPGPEGKTAIETQPTTPPVPAPSEAPPAPEVQVAASPEPSVTPLVQTEPTPIPTATPNELHPTTTSTDGFPWSEVGSRSTLQIYAKDFQLKRPRWGVQLNFSPGALGKTDISGGMGTYTRAFGIYADYQPIFAQSFGVLTFGPQVNIYPVLPMNGVVSTSIYSVWSYGAQVRYQMRFLREQLIVPVVGYDYESLHYNLLLYGNGTFPLTGPIVGLSLLLNKLEPSAAYEAYEDAGILRTYLTFELRSLKGSDSNLNISGTSYYGGLRVEF